MTQLYLGLSYYALQHPEAKCFASHRPLLLCCTGKTLVVSVFKHPLKPKKIGAELKSALKEVGRPAVPCFAALL